MAKVTTSVVATPVDPRRAEVEAKRGIVRDEHGKIVRSKAWKKERIVQLNQKLEDLNARAKNAKAEIKKLEGEL